MFKEFFVIFVTIQILIIPTKSKQVQPKNTQDQTIGKSTIGN